MKSKNKAKPQILIDVAELGGRLAFWEANETKRMRAEEASRESKEKFRYLVEKIKDWIWEGDTQGLIPTSAPWN